MLKNYDIISLSDNNYLFLRGCVVYIYVIFRKICKSFSMYIQTIIFQRKKFDCLFTKN